MRKSDKTVIAAVVVLAVIAAVVWFMPEGIFNVNGDDTSVIPEWINPWDDADSSVFMSSANKWLNTSTGRKVFPNSTLGEAVPVFNEEGKLYLWVVPVKNTDGLYTGYILDSSEEFRNPSSSIIYPEPKQTFIGRETAIDMHTYFILKYGNTYGVEHIMEPYVVTKPNGGYYWMSEIKENREVVDRVFVKTEFDKVFI